MKITEIENLNILEERNKKFEKGKILEMEKTLNYYKGNSVDDFEVMAIGDMLKSFTYNEKVLKAKYKI